MVVENNYGYTGPTSTARAAHTHAGVERVDIDEDGAGCHELWHSDEVSPSVVPKLSLRQRARLRVHQGPPGSGRPLVPDGARLPDGPDRLEAASRHAASASTTTTRR